MTVEESQAALAGALREVCQDVKQADMAILLGLSPAYFRKMLSEPWRLSRISADRLAHAMTQPLFFREEQIAVIDAWHRNWEARRKSKQKRKERPIEVTNANWRDWMIVSTSLLECGRDDAALAIGKTIYKASLKHRNAEWTVEAGREIGACLRLRGDYGVATGIAKQMLIASKHDGQSSPYYLLAHHNAALTLKAKNPFAVEDVNQRLVAIASQTNSEELRRLVLRDRLSTLWGGWLFRRDEPQDEIRRLVNRFEPSCDIPLEIYYDNEVLARSFAILNSDQAEQHLLLASKALGGVASAFQPKLNRAAMTQASVRRDWTKIERLWLSDPSRLTSFGRYDHYSRDMAALCARCR